MTISTSSPAYTDFSQFGALREKSSKDPDAALKEIAGQFESIFIGMMMKSMRDASIGDSLFDSNQSQMYRDMMDKQMSMELAANKGIGIADAIVKQLSPHIKQNGSTEVMPINAVNRDYSVKTDGYHISADQGQLAGTTQSGTAKGNGVVNPSFSSPQEFINAMWPLARKAAETEGLNPKALLAQAALETGWGKKIIRNSDQSSSFNLFNIKADNRWNGGKAVVDTLEYEGDLPKKVTAAFRSYSSFEESFRDYVDFVAKSPRYEEAFEYPQNGHHYIEKLHQGGYATDPEYSNKIKDIMSRIDISHDLGDTLKVSYAGTIGRK